MLRAHVLACLALLSACTDPPDARLTAASREDPACKTELVAALEALRDALGLGFEVQASDADTLAERGDLAKRYSRDAVAYTSEFGLDLADDVCAVQLWSMTEQRPGSTVTHTGDFGAVPLELCRCE